MMSHGRLRNEQRRLRHDCLMWWLGIPDDRELIALISLEGDEVQFIPGVLQIINVANDEV